MKKTYQSPLCQVMTLDDADVITTSFTVAGKGDNGDFTGGAEIEW